MHETERMWNFLFFRFDSSIFEVPNASTKNIKRAEKNCNFYTAFNIPSTFCSASAVEPTIDPRLGFRFHFGEN